MRLATILTALIAALCFPPSEAAACTSSKRNPGAASLSPSIYVNLSNVPSQYRSTVATGAKAWNRGGNNEPGQCPEGGFPQVTETYVGGTQRIISIIFQSGYQPSGNSDACGEFSGNMIVLYEYARIPATGQVVPCTRADILEDTAAHEMGHVYGLNDSGCGNHIMGGIGYNSGSYTNRTVRPVECSTVDDTHMTQAEIDEATGSPDGGDPGSPPGDPDCPAEGCSPILVDLDQGGFRLTDVAGGVRFDLDRDGVAEAISWTEPGHEDAWLALDRNENGSIDEGGELFGDATDQPASSAPNGYRALAVFDDNGDGRVSAADAAFGQLLLWTDANQDGVSQASELQTLADAGVVWVALDPVESRRRDQHGNEFRYKTLVRLGRGMTQSVDVFLLTAP